MNKLSGVKVGGLSDNPYNTIYGPTNFAPTPTE